MTTTEAIAPLHAEMTAWRRDIHAHPELGFQESRTAGLVAERLESFGLEVMRGCDVPNETLEPEQDAVAVPRHRHHVDDAAHTVGAED